MHLPRLGHTLLVSSGHTTLNNHQHRLAAGVSSVCWLLHISAFIVHRTMAAADERGDASLLLISGAPWPAGVRRHVVVLSVQHLPHKSCSAIAAGLLATSACPRPVTLHSNLKPPFLASMPPSRSRDYRFPTWTSLQLVRRGFFPKGGGCVKLHVQPSAQRPLPPLDLTQSPSWARITVRSFTAGRVGGSVAQRMVSAAKQRLSRVRGPAQQALYHRHGLGW